MTAEYIRRRTSDLIERTQFLKVLTLIIVISAIVFNLLPYVVRFPSENRDLVIQGQNTINNMGYVAVITYWFRNMQEAAKKATASKPGEEN